MLRTDLVVFSNNSMKIFWELPVSWKDNIILANKKVREISGISWKVSAKWLENRLRSNWCRIQGLCRTFFQQSASKNWNRGICKKDSFEWMLQGSSTGIPLDMDRKGNDQWRKGIKKEIDTNQSIPSFDSNLILFFSPESISLKW